MNWGRGLLRLWAVVSMLWLIASLLVFETPHYLKIAFTYRSQAVNISAPDREIGEGGDGQLDVQPDTTKSEVGQYDMDPDALAEEAVQLLVKRRIAQEKERRTTLATRAASAVYIRAVREIRIGLAVAFLPPIFLLILGMAFAWAVRGFKGDVT
jgi:hypothetical protein